MALLIQLVFTLEVAVSALPDAQAMARLNSSPNPVVPTCSSHPLIPLTRARTISEAFDKLLETSKWLMRYAGHEPVALLLCTLDTVHHHLVVPHVHLSLNRPLRAD